MPTSFQLTRLEEILHEEIPLSAAMEIEVCPLGDGFVVEAPLAPNRNQQQTFFGGSLSALGLIAGWSWIRLALREERLEPELVVQDSTMDFRRPAPGRTRARPHAPEADVWERFLSTLNRRGMARITLTVSIESPIPRSGATLMIGSGAPEPREVARMTGRFVAMRSG